MSLSLLKQPDTLMPAPIAAFLLHRLKIDIPVNPPKIVLVEGDEFRIDMNNMEPLQPYLMTFLDSRYVIWKNQDSALVMNEV